MNNSIECRMRGDVSCNSRGCQYCDCGQSRWYAQEQAEDGHRLAALLEKNKRPDSEATH